jgi:hypothetical protein
MNNINSVCKNINNDNTIPKKLKLYMTTFIKRISLIIRYVSFNELLSKIILIAKQD